MDELYIPPELWIEIHKFNEIIPSRKLSKIFHKVKTINNIRNYKTSVPPWVLWKCVYCKQPKGWAKFQN